VEDFHGGFANGIDGGFAGCGRWCVMCTGAADIFADTAASGDREFGGDDCVYGDIRGDL